MMRSELQLQRRCSNKTIKEETEMSQTLTQVSPRRDQNVSPQDHFLSKNSNSNQDAPEHASG